MPEKRDRAPTNVKELWYLIEAEQRSTNEWRGNLRETMQNINGRLSAIDSEVKEVDSKIRGEYVRQDYFEAVMFPIRNIVFGMVSLIIIGSVSFVGGLIYLLATQ